MIDLEGIQKFTEAELIILLDENGSVIDSVKAEYAINIALIVETVFSICEDLSEDLNNGDLVQLFGKSVDGYFIVNKLKDKSLIIIVTKDSSKLGLLLKYMNNEENFRKK